MNMFVELQLWAAKWKVPYYIKEQGQMLYLYFTSQSYSDPVFVYNKETGDFVWQGGD